MKIKYFAATENMGDNVTEVNADGYRAWAKSQLQNEFPDAEIEVSNKQNFKIFSCSADFDEETVGEFCQSLWDNCPWSWVK